MKSASKLWLAEIHFHFYGNFEIRVKHPANLKFSPQQITLLQAIVTSSRTAREIARMALETDLSDISSHHFENKYCGSSNEDILNCVLACLPEHDQHYWEELRKAPGDILHNQLMPVFFSFEVALKSTGINEISEASDALKKSMGPTIDSNKIH